jgi:hypothetical protein
MNRAGDLHTRSARAASLILFGTEVFLGCPVGQHPADRVMPGDHGHDDVAFSKTGAFQ